MASYQWQQSIRIGLLMLLLMFVGAACQEKTDAPNTPTPAFYPTQTPNETQIAEAWTKTPTTTPSITASATASQTRPPTLTISPSSTASQTSTSTPTSTATATPSATMTLSRTPLPTRTPRPSLTPSRTATDTPSPTSTATATATHTATATATSSKTETQPPTPLPTIGISSPTPTLTATSPDNRLENRTDTPIGTRPAPVSNRTLTAEATDLPTAIATGAGINAGTPQPFASITPLPSLPPVILPTFTPIWGGTGVPGGGDLVLLQNGIITTLDGRTFGTGRTFDFSPTGQSAIWQTNNQISVNGQVIQTGPVDANGLLAGLAVSDMQWSPNGRYLAIVTSGQGVTDYASGIWIHDTTTGSSHMIMKNVDERRARHVEWTDDSTAVIARLQTPQGGAVGAIHRDNTSDNFWMHPFEDATWSADGTSMIVSGMVQGGGVVLGRVHVTLPDQPYEGYDFSGSGINFVRAATELPDGRLAFLGSSSPGGPFYLYLMQPGTPPQAVSAPIDGWLLAWEWNPGRSGLMVVTDSGGVRQLWIVSPDGAIRNVIPPGGVPDYIHWN